MKHCQRCGRELPDDAAFCSACGSLVGKVSREEYSVSSEDLVKTIKHLIHEGNVTRIVVKSEKDETLLEIPATVGVIGAILAPWMAALGVIAAIATKCKIIVERRE
ncbi:MAG: DUF4342 domain-containing protein [Candidatus Brockarchaeota archaeon]|nr:DUF4342 domain-containing protein [Candidatus Brockarchaeota archaeon]